MYVAHEGVACVERKERNKTKYRKWKLYTQGDGGGGQDRCLSHEAVSRSGWKLNPNVVSGLVRSSLVMLRER